MEGEDNNPVRVFLQNIVDTRDIVDISLEENQTLVNQESPPGGFPINVKRIIDSYQHDLTVIRNRLTAAMDRLEGNNNSGNEGINGDPTEGGRRKLNRKQKKSNTRRAKKNHSLRR